jgi:hypothetical protein
MESVAHDAEREQALMGGQSNAGSTTNRLPTGVQRSIQSCSKAITTAMPLAVHLPPAFLT